MSSLVESGGRIYRAAEATKNPIFLFQSGYLHSNGPPSGFVWSGERETFLKEEYLDSDLDRDALEELGAIFDAQKAYEDGAMTSDGYAAVRIDWQTDTVFFSRKEAAAYGHAYSYRWDYWRVYCTYCTGELSEILLDYELDEATDPGGSA